MMRIEAHNIEPYLPPFSDLMPYDTVSGPVSVTHTIDEHLILSLHGVNHTSSPADPHFAELRSGWESFLHATDESSDRRLVVIEGRPHYANEFSSDPKTADEEAIQLFGESALTCLWAEREDVEVLRPETSTRADAHKLLQIYAPEEVVTFYALRQATQLLPQWQEGIPTLPYDTYITDYLTELRELTSELAPLANYDFSYDHFQETHQYFLGAPPSKEQAYRYLDILSAFKDPAKAAEPLTRVCEASNNNRDLFIGTVLVNKLVEGRSLFGAYGWYHVRRLKPLLDVVAQRLTEGYPALPELE